MRKDARSTAQRNQSRRHGGSRPSDPDRPEKPPVQSLTPRCRDPAAGAVVRPFAARRSGRPPGSETSRRLIRRWPLTSTNRVAAANRRRGRDLPQQADRLFAGGQSRSSCSIASRTLPSRAASSISQWFRSPAAHRAADQLRRRNLFVVARPSKPAIPDRATPTPARSIPTSVSTRPASWTL